MGFEIFLHCFQYGNRTPQKELEKYAKKVFYYPRKRSIFSIFNKIPFIVATRKNKTLIQNLTINNAPILFEGLHTCGFLNHQLIKDRLKFARMHNVEHDYYHALAKNSKGWRKLFFQIESKKLKEFLPVLQHAQHLFVLQENDYSFFKQIHSSVFLLPISLPEFKMNKPVTTENYCLFHGNLSVAENINAIHWFIENVKELQNQHFIVAGKDPSKALIHFCKKNKVTIIPNPSEEKMQQLIHFARIHLLYTNQSTGIKIKLLNALNSSGRVIVNPKMIEGTSLSYHVEIALNGEDFSKKIDQGIKHPLTEKEIEERWNKIKEEFDTKKNLQLLEGLINN